MEFLFNLQWVCILIAAAVAYVVSLFWYAPILFGKMTQKKKSTKNSLAVLVVLLIAVLFLTILTGMVIEAYSILAGVIVVALPLVLLKLSSALFLGQSGWMTVVSVGYRIAIVVIIGVVYWIGDLLLL